MACLGLPSTIAEQVSQFPMISTEIISLRIVICISIHLHPKTTKDWALLIEMLNLSFEKKVSRWIPWNERCEPKISPPNGTFEDSWNLCQRWDMFSSLKVIPEVFEDIQPGSILMDVRPSYTENGETSTLKLTTPTCVST